MATRFHLQSSTGADVLPAIPAGWADTSQVSFFKLFRTPQSTLVAAKQAGESTGASPYQFLHLAFVSEPLAPHLVSGSVKGQMHAIQSGTLADFSYGFRARIVSRDGSTNRGTLFDNLSSVGIGTEYSVIGRQNRHFPPSSGITPVACHRGDRVVLEFGTIAFNSSAADFQASLYYGDNGAGGDLPENETDNDATKNPWVEFSHDFFWESDMEDGEGTSAGGSSATGTAQAKAQAAGTSAGGSTATGIAHANAFGTGSSGGSSTAEGTGQTQTVTPPQFIFAAPRVMQIAAGDSLVIADERFAYVTMFARRYPIRFT